MMFFTSESQIYSLLTTISPLIWGLLGISLYLVHSLFLYPFLLSPVRHIPGPWYARISRLPLRYVTWKRRRSRYATRLLESYGPVVVIAPDQVHTTDDIAMRDIYDKSAIKTSFYSSMGSWKGVTSTMGFLDYASSAPSRNNLIQCFQNKNLTVLVDTFQSHVDDFIRLLEKKTRAHQWVDGIVVFRLLALDIITDVLWGEENRLLHNFKEDESPLFILRFHAFSTWNAMRGFIPGADLFVKYFGSKKWKDLQRECNNMDLTAKEALKRWEAGNNPSHRQRDVLSMLQAMNKTNESAVPTRYMPAYMVEMLAAGSSTTSHTATFACWSLTRHPEAQRALHAELFEAFPQLDSIDIKKTLDLPYLDAVIRETMRLYPIIPGPLERHLGKDVCIAGRLVPKGVIASTAAYDQGRLEAVYPQATLWRPGRWLHATERMKHNWIPFGHGCRACPGSNVAITELKYILGMVFRRFRAVMPPGMETDPMALQDVFAASPISGSCWLKFEELDEKAEKATFTS